MKKTLIILLGLILLINCSINKEEQKTQIENNKEKNSLNSDLADTSSIPGALEKFPKFPGGEEKLYSFIKQKMNYPDYAKKNNIEGRVYIQFIVQENGKITDIEIVKGIGYGCDEESQRIINLMPNWIPGEREGVKVDVKYTMPIIFKLK